jgi:protein-S-isoprenylcysteine O-methyltransferase Ste14
MMNTLLAHGIWAAGIVGWFVIRYPFQRRARRLAVNRSTGGLLDRSLLAIAAAGQIFVPGFYVFFGFAGFADYGLNPWQAWLGLPVLAAALLLFRLTHKQLGRNWSITLETREKHRLVTDGLYAYVRHPMYSSFFLLASAQALLLQNWIAGSIGLVSVALLFFIRVGREERLMIETFGDEYRAYAKTTARVIPWLL